MTKLKINIPEPCHEDWNNMLTIDQGKFCSSCQKCVVDFSTYSDEALLNYFKTPRVNTCGQFTTHQLDRLILPPPTPKQSFFSRAFLGIAVLLSLFQKAEADKLTSRTIHTQNFKYDNSPEEPGPFGRTGTLPDSLKYISGKIMDSSSGDELFGSLVKIAGTQIEAVADMDGRFKLVIPDSLLNNKISLEASSLGFQKKIVHLDKISYPYIANINLESKKTSMKGEVQIIMGKVAVPKSQR